MRYIPGAMLAAHVASGLLMSGCGNMKAPLAPGQAVTVQQTDGNALVDDAPFAIAFSPRAFDPSKARASKPTASKQDKGWFSPRKSGELGVDFYRRSSAIGVGVDQAKFEVKGGSLNRDVVISMTVF